MKAKRIILLVLMFLPLGLCLIALPFLPEQIPAHYGFNNQVDRWGSKYEVLIFPLITILFGVIMLIAAWYASKKEEGGKNNENICLITGICCLALFNAITAYFLYIDLNQVQNLSSTVIDINQLIFAILSIFMIIVGNIMPKTRLNSMIGLRTKWSMQNETVWKKSQRFGGISFIAAGIVIFIISCLTRGVTCLIISLGILLVTCVVDVIYTYIAAKNTN